MNFSPILIVAGEPNSVFLEIFFKMLKSTKVNNPIIIIASENILIKQMKKLNFKRKIKLLNYNNLNTKILNNKSINLININFNQKKAFESISKKSNKYIEKSFQTAFNILKRKKIYKFINGPVSKKYFLNKKYLGVTEFIASKFTTKENCMLIYNKKLSVSPVTTHLPVKRIAKKLAKN